MQRCQDAHFFLVGAVVCLDSVSVGGRGSCEGMGDCWRGGEGREGVRSTEEQRGGEKRKGRGGEGRVRAG